MLIDRYPNLVILIGPDLVALDHPQLISQVPSDQKHRLIRCETILGATHALKHLRASMVILPNDVSEKVAADIAAFVGDVVILHNDEKTDEILQSLLS